MVIKVTEILKKEGLKPAILTRGYKRRTGGILEVTKNSSVTDTGDEPMILFRHCKDVPVVLAANRIKGVNFILKNFQPVNILVMDDGFQHRWIKPSMSILLTTFQKPFTADRLLPAGYLREPSAAARRAQLIVVTKTPAKATDEQKQHLLKQIGKYSPAPVIFSSLLFQKPKNIFNGETLHEPLSFYHCMAVAGIANDADFMEFIRSRAKQTESISFPNHHHYTKADAERIANGFNNIAAEKKIIITTGKDAVKLIQYHQLLPDSIYQLDALPDFLPEEEIKLKTELLKHARKD